LEAESLELVDTAALDLLGPALLEVGRTGLTVGAALRQQMVSDSQDVAADYKGGVFAALKYCHAAVDGRQGSVAGTACSMAGFDECSAQPPIAPACFGAAALPALSLLPGAIPPQLAR
jgi:hypothetical protein